MSPEQQQEPNHSSRFFSAIRKRTATAPTIPASQEEDHHHDNDVTEQHDETNIRLDDLRPLSVYDRLLGILPMAEIRRLDYASPKYQNVKEMAERDEYFVIGDDEKKQDLLNQWDAERERIMCSLRGELDSEFREQRRILETASALKKGGVTKEIRTSFWDATLMSKYSRTILANDCKIAGELDAHCAEQRRTAFVARKLYLECIQAEEYWQKVAGEDDKRVQEWNSCTVAFRKTMYNVLQIPGFRMDENAVRKALQERFIQKPDPMALFNQKCRSQSVTFPLYPPYASIVATDFEDDPVISADKVLSFFDSLNLFALGEEHSEASGCHLLYDESRSIIILPCDFWFLFLLDRYFDVFAAAYIHRFLGQLEQNASKLDRFCNSFRTPERTTQHTIVFSTGGEDEDEFFYTGGSLVENIFEFRSLWLRVGRFATEYGLALPSRSAYVVGCFLESGYKYPFDEFDLIFTSQKDIEQLVTGIVRSQDIDQLVRGIANTRQTSLTIRGPEDELSGVDFKTLFCTLKFYTSISDLTVCSSVHIDDDFGCIGSLTSINFLGFVSHSAAESLALRFKDPDFSIKRISFPEFGEFDEEVRSTILTMAPNRKKDLHFLSDDYFSVSLPSNKGIGNDVLSIVLGVTFPSGRNFLVNALSDCNETLTSMLTDMTMCANVVRIRVCFPEVVPDTADFHRHPDGRFHLSFVSASSFKTVFSFLMTNESLETVNDSFVRFLRRQVRRFASVPESERMLSELQNLDMKNAFFNHCIYHHEALTRFKDAPKRIDALKILRPCQQRTFDLDVKYMLIRQFPGHFMSIRRKTPKKWQKKRKLADT